MSKSYTVSAQYDYVSGYLRYGHKEMTLNEEEFLKFKDLSKKDQLEWLVEEGEIVIDDFEVNDYGELEEIIIEEN